LPSLALGSFSYIAAHAGSLILVLATIFFLFKALREIWGGSIAKAAILPTLLFFVFNQKSSFVHYSSEHLPMALLAVAAWLIAKCYRENRYEQTASFALGGLLAVLPFTKPQVIPIALFLAIASLLIFIKKHSLRREGVWFLGGGLLLLTLTTGLMLYWGVLSDFFTFYIAANFLYGSNTSWAANIMRLPLQATKTADISLYLLPLGLLGLSSCTNKLFRSEPLTSKKILGFASAWFAITILAISRTGSGYAHHWLFAICPVTILFGYFFSQAAHHKQPALIILFLCLLLFLTNLAGDIKEKRILNRFPYQPDKYLDFDYSEISKTILRYRQDKDSLVVWGWNCSYHVETQLPQGVAENHTIRSFIYPEPFRKKYRDRYISDINRNKPVFFVDAVGGRNNAWFNDKATQSYESFPELASYIQKNYNFAGNFDGGRLYIRKDRYPHQIRLEATD